MNEWLTTKKLAIRTVIEGTLPMFTRTQIDQNDKFPHFIGSWKFEDKSLCDNLIEFFESNPDSQRSGVTTSGLDEDRKKSIDMSIKPNQLQDERYALFKTYIERLVGCYNDYKEQWPFLKNIKDMEIGTFNFMKYEKGGHFSAVHTERGSAQNMHRVLAFMTYMNDVDDCGETTFVHYGLKVKPEKGLTLIWPAEWTHAHYGGVVQHGCKYIITGWIQFK